MRSLMRVVELTAYHVRIPLVRPVRHASHTRDSTDNLVLRCVLDDRTEGFGEGVPREYVTGETIDSAVALLRRSDLAPQMEPCRDFAAAWAAGSICASMPTRRGGRPTWSPASASWSRSASPRWSSRWRTPTWRR